MSGYQQLLCAACGLTETNFLEDIDQVSLKDAESYVARNRECLASARCALNEKCSVPLEFDASFFTERCGDIQPMRHLVDAFRLELTIAKSRSKFDEAARCAVDILELGTVFRRGGLIVDFLVALAIQDTAVHELRRFRTQMDEPTRAMVIEAIGRVEHEQDSLIAIADRDRKWETAFNWHDQPISETPSKTSNDSDLSEIEESQVRESLQSFVDSPPELRNSLYAQLDRRNMALRRLLILDLAIRSYQQAHSSYPDSLLAMVPSTLSELPLDPFTDQPFVYRRNSGESFLVYSPGPSRIDHGGAFGHWLMVANGGADYCLDTGDYALDCCSNDLCRPSFISIVVGSIRTAWDRLRRTR